MFSCFCGVLVWWSAAASSPPRTEAPTSLPPHAAPLLIGAEREPEECVTEAVGPPHALVRPPAPCLDQIPSLLKALGKGEEQFRHSSHNLRQIHICICFTKTELVCFQCQTGLLVNTYATYNCVVILCNAPFFVVVKYKVTYLLPFIINQFNSTILQISYQRHETQVSAFDYGCFFSLILESSGREARTHSYFLGNN